MKQRKCLLAVCLTIPLVAWPCGVRGADQPSEPFLGAYVSVGPILVDKTTPKERDQAIGDNLDQFRDAGLRVLIPDAVAPGPRAEYPSRLIDKKLWGSYDPLAVMIREAHRRGLQVYPAVCVLISVDPKKNYSILHRHPEWALRDKDRQPMSWISPAHPEARRWIVSVLQEIVEYHPDGIVLDFLRYPGNEVFLDPMSQEKFDAAHPADKFPPGSKEHKEALRMFKRNCLTELAGEINGAVRALDPKLRIVLYTFRVEDFLVGTRDWPLWVERGYVDHVNLSGSCYPKKYGPNYLETMEKRFRTGAESLRKTGKPVEFTLCLHIQLEDSKIEQTKDIEQYLTTAKRCGATGAVFFTWAYLQPHVAELKKAGYLEQFQAGLKPLVTP